MCPGQIGSHLFFFYLGPKEPRWVHFLHTSNSSSSELKNKFPVNQMETFWIVDENTTFDVFWPYSGPKIAKNMAPWSVFYTLEN